jgi:hypothetical protein
MGRTAAKRDPKALIHEVFTREAAHMSLDEAVASIPLMHVGASAQTGHGRDGSSTSPSTAQACCGRRMKRPNPLLLN